MSFSVFAVQLISFFKLKNVVPLPLISVVMFFMFFFKACAQTRGRQQEFLFDLKGSQAEHVSGGSNSAAQLTCGSAEFSAARPSACRERSTDALTLPLVSNSPPPRRTSPSSAEPADAAWRWCQPTSTSATCWCCSPARVRGGLSGTP